MLNGIKNKENDLIVNNVKRHYMERHLENGTHNSNVKNTFTPRLTCHR